MSSLYEVIKKRMELFEVDLPFAIKELKVDEDGELLGDVEERVVLKGSLITFELSVDHSFQIINELVAKVKLGEKYGDLLTTQIFSTKIDKKMQGAFYKATSPLVNAYAFQMMQRYLSPTSMMKEKMEWQSYYESILEISNRQPSEDLLLLLLALYVTLSSCGVVESKIPKSLSQYKHAISVYSELLESEPSAYQMCMSVNRALGGKYYCALDQQDGKEMFLMRESTREDFYDIGSVQNSVSASGKS